MKLLSEACEYALRAVVWMALHPGEPHKVRDIALAPEGRLKIEWAESHMPVMMKPIALRPAHLATERNNTSTEGRWRLTSGPSMTSA